jgi:hypothetical protein
MLDTFDGTRSPTRVWGTSVLRSNRGDHFSHAADAYGHEDPEPTPNQAPVARTRA